MKNINEIALPTLGTTGTVGTNSVAANSPVAISNAIANLSKTIAAAGNAVDPTVKQTLLNLQKAHAVATQKAVKQAKMPKNKRSKPLPQQLQLNLSLLDKPMRKRIVKD